MFNHLQYIVALVCGAQWGDEGKGKLVDFLSEFFDIIARYQGGNNAGHTVWISGIKYVLKLIPSGILNPGKTCLIGNGVVLDPVAFHQEVADLEEMGISCKGRLFVSDRCHLIFPPYKALEQIREAKLGDKKIGTTAKGIGIAYEYKARRFGIRAGETCDLEKIRERILEVLEETNLQIQALGGTPVEADTFLEEYMEALAKLREYVRETSLFLNKAIQAGCSILGEGGQGVLLSLDHGTYPFVTSSEPGVGGMVTGLGIPAKALKLALAIVKAYTTRVGEGPFVTEDTGILGNYLRTTGSEYGAVTGRDRRCGWFDAMLVRYSHMINGFDAMALTKLDILDGLDEIQVCTDYRLDGKLLESFPANLELLQNCEPVYVTLPGWKTSTTEIRHYEDLPAALRDYSNFIGKICGFPVDILSVGPDREQTIIRPDSTVYKLLK